VPQLDPRKPPPPDYYASNVRFLLDEVRRRSGELLDAREAALIEAFQRQPVSAQRLFARLVSRTGPWIRLDSLHYPEVGNVADAVARLAEAGLVRVNPAAPAAALLKLLTRAELAALFPRVAGRTKPEWLADCLGRYPDRLIRARLARACPWVDIADREAFATCAVLFFGSDEADLSTFVVQDLGVRCYERYPLGPDSRPFRERAELDRYLLSRRLSPWSSRLDEVPALAGQIPRLLWPEARTRTEQRARDKVLNRVGRWHERRGEHDAALTCYGRSTSHPARERRARLLHRLGDAAAVAELLAAMREDPWGPEEADFAARFPGRRPPAGIRTSLCVLPGATPARIERHALAVLTANGGRGWHLENLLPLGLAGLAFWDVVFAPLPGVFTHPFQLGPRDLFWPDFARSRRGLIDDRFEQLRRPGAFEAEVRRSFAAKRGIANALVHWGAFRPELLDALLADVPHGALLALARQTLCNLRVRRTGFPDLLLIYGPHAWELVEVKGPTDQLQPAQREWLRVLDEAGLPARVLRFRSSC